MIFSMLFTSLLANGMILIDGERKVSISCEEYEWRVDKWRSYIVQRDMYI